MIGEGPTPIEEEKKEGLGEQSSLFDAKDIEESKLGEGANLFDEFSPMKRDDGSKTPLEQPKSGQRTPLEYGGGGKYKKKMTTGLFKSGESKLAKDMESGINYKVLIEKAM